MKKIIRLIIAFLIFPALAAALVGVLYLILKSLP